MSKWLGTPAFWGITFGLGLGIAIGVILATGIGFDRGDTARFVGALIGSLIAVSGAVALHYLKISEEEKDRLEKMETLIQDNILYAEEAIELRDNPDEYISAIHAFIDQAERTLRFASHHEFVSLRINDARHFLVDVDTEEFEIDDLKDPEEYSEEELDHALRQLRDFRTVSKNALVALAEGSDYET